MDIAESNVTYVVTVELPGVNADGIRVEVNNDRWEYSTQWRCIRDRGSCLTKSHGWAFCRLLVSGSRSGDIWVDKSKQSEEAVYHRRELARGPFRAHWLLPKNSNIDSISAEFMWVSAYPSCVFLLAWFLKTFFWKLSVGRDGFLRILVPKNTLWIIIVGNVATLFVVMLRIGWMVLYAILTSPLSLCSL